MTSPDPPRRIALVKLGAMGDCVNILPFVNRLRAGYREAEIVWIIGREAHSLLKGHPAVDRFVVVDKSKPWSWRAPARELRREGVDLAIDLQRILKSAWLLRCLRARRSLGFDRARSKELSWLGPKEHIAPNAQPGVTVAQYLEFADHLELPDQAPTWNLDVGKVPKFGNPERPRVALNLGASKPANHWPAERWHELAALLIARTDAQVILCGGPTDRAVAVEVASGLPAKRFENFVGVLSWKDTAAMLGAVNLLIAGDTGPLHVAVAVGTPVLALFGAADPQRTGPFERPGSVFSRPAPCSPCRRKTCNVEGHPCMTQIHPRELCEEAQQCLDRLAKST
ncbi:MAG: glycosyltransferase family 9 protein [Planctomycetota bacterium]